MGRSLLKKMKKELQDFMKDESGVTSKEKILKIGIGTIGALGMFSAFSADNALAGHSSHNSHDVHSELIQEWVTPKCWKLETEYHSHDSHNSHESY